MQVLRFRRIIRLGRNDQGVMRDSKADSVSRAPEKGIGECPVHRRAEALRLLAAANEPAGMQALAEAVDGACAAHWRGLRISLGADGELDGAIWVQPMPGGCAALWPPTDGCRRKPGLLREAGRWADQSGLYFTQVILTRHPDDKTRHELEQTGFRYLADLASLAGSPNEAGLSESAASVGLEEVRWEVLRDDNHHRFATLFDAVNADTRDFPELVQSRPTHAVYESFLARGGWKEGLWKVLSWHGRDAALLLLAPHPAARSMELLFMGVHPSFRGCGLGRAVTQEALAIAREHGFQLILTADTRNRRAVELYRTAGLETVGHAGLFVRFNQSPYDQM